MPHDLWRTLPALTALLAAIWGAGLWLFHSERPQRAMGACAEWRRRCLARRMDHRPVDVDGSSSLADAG